MTYNLGARFANLLRPDELTRSVSNSRRRELTVVVPRRGRIHLESGIEFPPIQRGGGCPGTTRSDERSTLAISRQPFCTRVGVKRYREEVHNGRGRESVP